jgi:hypothetical protein
VEIGILVMFGAGLAFVLIALYGIYAGIRRMQGHRTRFDAVFETFARAQGAGVYPPSLRGDPNPQVQEAVEVDRGDSAVRATPGESAQKR